MQCHTKLSIRKPEATSLGRIAGFNKPAIATFFENLNDVLVKHTFQSYRIFNVDKTGITTVPTPNKIVGPKK